MIRFEQKSGLEAGDKPSYSRRRRRWAQLVVEQLEDRRLLSVTYHGGPLLRNVEVETLFYGQAWASDPALAPQINQINNFFSYITNSPYMDMLGEYGIGRGSFLNGTVDPANLSGIVDDSQIGDELIAEIARGRLQPPDSNRVYFIFTAPGVEVSFTDSDNVLETSGKEAGTPHFLGYHESIPARFGPDIYLAVIPYPGGVNNQEEGLTAFQQLTAISSHELAEAATDPDSTSGWYDDKRMTDGEIADLCAGQYGTINGFEVQYEWSNQANGPVLPMPSNLQAVANAFTHSGEYFAMFITHNYQQLLGRAPAAGEVDSWVQLMQQGISDEQVLAGFIGSGEYYNRQGGTDKAWVDALYRDVLGRLPDAGGENAWLQALAGGTQRGTVAYGFAASFERESTVVRNDYQRFLGRGASDAEVNYWVNAFQHGVANEQVVAGFVGSAEAFHSHASNIDQWLTYAYFSILGRSPDQSGFANWQAVLNGGLQ